MNKNHFHIIIAGGSGQRFWPLSRLSKPKQLLSLIHEKSLIRLTIDRIKKFSSLENIFVVSNQFLANKISKEIPELNKNNFIIEPSAKNTAPAIGFATSVVNQIDSSAIVSIYPSDHYISKVDKFNQAIDDSYKFLQSHNGILVLGIPPTNPSTGYGYIESSQVGENNIFEVDRFIEKPKLKKAREFIKDKNYFWNSGVFIFKSSYMLNQFEKLLPEIYTIVRDLTKEPKISHLNWDQINPISFDHGILEKTKSIYMHESKFDWSDVGSWDTLYDFLSKKNNKKNISFGNTLIQDSSGNLIYGNKGLTVLSGIKDMVVINTDDVTLVIPMDKAQNVKDIIDKIEESYR